MSCQDKKYNGVCYSVTPSLRAGKKDTILSALATKQSIFFVRRLCAPWRSNWIKGGFFPACKFGSFFYCKKEMNIQLRVLHPMLCRFASGQVIVTKKARKLIAFGLVVTKLVAIIWQTSCPLCIWRIGRLSWFFENPALYPIPSALPDRLPVRHLLP